MSINEITEGTANKILQRRGEKEKWDENDWDWLRTLTEISQEEWSEIVSDGNSTLHEEETAVADPSVKSLKDMYEELLAE